MANPLAALGRALVGGGDGGGQAKDLWEAIRIDDAGAVSHFLSRGSDVNERGPVRSFYLQQGADGPVTAVKTWCNAFLCSVLMPCGAKRACSAAQRATPGMPSTSCLHARVRHCASMRARAGLFAPGLC